MMFDIEVGYITGILLRILGGMPGCRSRTMDKPKGCDPKPTKPGGARTYHDGGIVVGVEGDRAPPELEVAQAAHEARRGPHPAPQSLPLFFVTAL